LKTLIAVPVTERGVWRLSKRLPGLVKRYGSIALPLPQSLCVKVVTSFTEALDYAFKLMKPAGFRVWSSLLHVLKDTVIGYPDVDIGCYTSEDTYAVSEARGYSIAALSVKAKAFNIVKPEEWLDVFKGSHSEMIVEMIAKYDAIVADGYSWTVRLKSEIKPAKVLVLDTLIPTPFDILELMALGYLDTSIAREVIAYAVKYVDYIVTSFTLTQAYDKLLKDESYLELLKELKLKVYRVKEGLSSLNHQSL
jgi:hypothetical protein